MSLASFPPFLFLAFVLGAIIGSFLNVVILRYNTGRGVGGRSGCFSCGKELIWLELIPIVSFMVQKGKCRKCSAKLSWQYPIVEALTGLVFLGLFWMYGATFTFLFQVVIWSLLIVILVYDIRHKIIPDSIVYVFNGFALAAVVAQWGAINQTVFLTWILAGPILFMPFFFLWFISKGKWIGLGDGKLALGMGWLLGLGLGISAIILAFWIGAFVSVMWLLITRLKNGRGAVTMKSEIPFAPFLILALALVYFLKIDVLGLYTVLGI